MQPASVNSFPRVISLSTLGTRITARPVSIISSIARFARNKEIPRFARASAALTVLSRFGFGPTRSDRRRGERDGTGARPRRGPGRGSRSFNDDDIVVHPVHGDIGQKPKISRAHRVGSGALRMEASQHQLAAVLLRFGHH